MSGPILETLYAPTRKDRLSGLAQNRFFQTLTSAAAGTSLAVTFSAVPPDAIRVIQGIAVLLTPGAAQFALEWRLDMLDLLPSTTVLAQLAGRVNSQRGAADVVADQQIIDFLSVTSDRVRASASFNAGVASNSIRASIWGYEIPRGNLQR